MLWIRRRAAVFFALFALLGLVATVDFEARAEQPLPRFAGHHLLVGGKPFLIFGGELSNSSSSNREFTAPRWSKLRAMHLNTVLMPVSWELVEPQEGQFDFKLVDGLLADAGASGLHVVILWFGSWKNSQSSYAPAWVKTDYRRFPRARARNGHALEFLTPFSKANADADAKAFGALMSHLAMVDRERICIMVQVENEIGMIPDSRDYSQEAQRAWARPVPKGLKGAGESWSHAYGDDAASAFMADAFARYVEVVAQAGKSAYPLPLYVNASLRKPGATAGKDYPSGGPLPEVADIWRGDAPSVDLLAPDIYFPNFTEWAGRYNRLNPLFIPEADWAGKREAPANALLAFGAYGAIGFSPFAIDDVDTTGEEDLAGLYAMLQSIEPLILERQGTDRIAGFRPRVSFDGQVDLSSQRVVIGKHLVTAHFVDPWTPQVEHDPQYRGAVIMMLAPDTFVVAGRGVTFTFAPANGRGEDGIESVEEGAYEAGEWHPTRRLNGDDTYAGRHVRLNFDRFDVQKLVLYHYE